MRFSFTSSHTPYRQLTNCAKQISDFMSPQSQLRLEAIEEGLVVTFDNHREHDANSASHFGPVRAESSDSEGTVHWQISSRTVTSNRPMWC